MKQFLLTLLLLVGIARAATGDSISGNWRCQTISYQQYGNNYLIFIDNTHWQHKEDGSLHGEGKLEVRIYSKNSPQARLHFDYASDGSWRQAGDKILLETIKPRLVPSNKTEAAVRLAAENIARDVNNKPQQTVASNIIYLGAHQLILEDRESHDFTRCRR